MSLSDAKQKFSELRKKIIHHYASDRESDIRSLIDLLKEYPALCSDALDMIKENSYRINFIAELVLINNIMRIKPKLNADIIKNIERYIDSDLKDTCLGAIVKTNPEIFQYAKEVADDKISIINAFVDAKDKLSEKDVNLIMKGGFSYKSFLRLYSENRAEGLNFIEKFSKGNPDNLEIQKKCLLLICSYAANENTNRITNEILALQPELKEFSALLNTIKLRTLTPSRVEQADDEESSIFEYTTGHSDSTQIQNRMILKGDKKNVIASYIEQKEKEQELLKSPEKLREILNGIDFSDDISSVLASSIYAIVERTENEDILKILSHKKEEIYGVWDYDAIRGLEECFAGKNYIEKTLNKKYPNLPLEEQLIQAAYDVVNSGDEQKKKEFNEFILAEGEPRLSELDAKVMDYLYENCTQNNLDKVNALRSFYGLKVELKTGNTVDIDERTAVRKVFDRTWSSYERGKNDYTGEPYYSEREMEEARKENPEQVISNPYYENAVSPAYRKYFEEHDIYEMYNRKKK